MRERVAILMIAIIGAPLWLWAGLYIWAITWLRSETTRTAPNFASVYYPVYFVVVNFLHVRASIVAGIVTGWALLQTTSRKGRLYILGLSAAVIAADCWLGLVL